MPDLNLMTELTCIGSAQFSLQYRQEFSRMAGGNPRVSDMGPELWMAKVQTTELKRTEFLKAEAEFNRLRGSLNTFYMYPPYAPGPQSDYLGTILGASNVQIHTVDGDNKRLRLKNLPIGYVLTKGDYLSFQSGSSPIRTHLHQLVTGGTADGTGVTPLMECAPSFRVGIATNLVVTLIRPFCEMMIMPGTYEARTTKPPYSQITFNAIQVF